MHKYFAFDSFEGFPLDVNVKDHAQYKPGGAKTGSDEFTEPLTAYGQSTERVALAEGFYDRSLPESLANKFVDKKAKASLITVDCNLYESYRSVFAWVDQFMQPGTVLYLDDYNTFRAQPNKGPKRAWNEYKETSDWNFEPFLPVGFWGYSFIVC